jgi:hypothetical protein
MGLPKIDLPLFETKIVSTGEKVKFRPFTVKEEKILLIAQETRESEQIILAMKQIISNCCQGDINADDLPMFDLEYLLLQIRGKSVNNTISFTVTDPDTNSPVECEIDIEDIKLNVPEGHTNIIPVDDNTQIVMGYPKLNEVSLFMEIGNPDVNQAEALFNVMLGCVESVVVGDEVQHLNDFSKEEVDAFLGSLPGEATVALKNFFETMPQLSYTLEYTNTNGDEKKMVLTGTETFFL